MRNRRVRLFFLAFVLAITLVGQGAVSAQYGKQTSHPGYALGAYDPIAQTEVLTYPQAAPPVATSPNAIESAADEIVRLINEERRAAGLYPYKVNLSLAITSEQHSIVMRDQGCFSHKCDGEPAVPARACNAGYHPYGWGECFIGETIAAGYVNPANVVAAWMASAGHREILMHGELREIGVGYVTGGYYGHYWTVDFGSQPDVLPVFINYDDLETDTRQVTLTLDNEEVSGWGGIDYAHDVMISNDPNFVGAQWELYTLHKSWTLAPGNGQKTVYVKYRDPLGDEVVSSDDILLNVLVEFELALSSDKLIFYYQIGSGFTDSPQASVKVMNGAGSSPMNWDADAQADWLGFVPTNGTTPDDLEISVESFTTNEPGTSETAIAVTSPQTPDAPAQVTVAIVATEKVHRVMLPIVSR